VQFYRTANRTLQLTSGAPALTLTRRTMDSITFATIAEITENIRNRKISPVEIVEAHCRRIQTLQPRLNAFAHVDFENARSLARAAETAISSGTSIGPLHGVPLTVKSCIDVAGWPCAVGSRLRKDYVPRHDAPLVARLKAGGAIIIGNTSTPEFLMAYETNNALTGKTSNPWDLSRTAGGSSGGEAAAIASGCSAGGVGSDGGGSIRVPAHFSGICGLKSTPGRIPASGHYPPPGGAFSWLGVVGPMARTIADVRSLFQIIAGPDPGDALSAPVAPRSFQHSALRGLRIGILESDTLGRVTPETDAIVKRAAKLLSENHFVVEPFRLEGLDQALDLWWLFFGEMVGYLFHQLVSGHENDISPMLREYLAVAVSKIPPTLDQFMNACVQRDLLRAAILRQMRDVPILLSPVSAAPAFRHGEGNWQPGTGYRDTMRHSQWVNLVGFPGVSVPIGLSSENQPIGVQIIGRPYEEELVLAVAETLENARGPWKKPPIANP